MTTFSVPELWNIVETLPEGNGSPRPGRVAKCWPGWSLGAVRGGAMPRRRRIMSETEALVHAINAIHRHACPAGYHRTGAQQRAQSAAQGTLPGVAP